VIDELPVGEPDVASVGALIGDPARCRILLALVDGRELPATRLAAAAEVSPATASSHLGKLSAAGLVRVTRAGRYRYYRLAGPEVASLIETLELFAPPVRVRSPRQIQHARLLREARICYDHLCGRVGVSVLQSMIDRGRLLEGRLTPNGLAFLGDLGVDVAPGHCLVRHHPDSSEGKPHLVGKLGADLLQRFLGLDWLRRAPVGRAVVVTRTGRTGFGTYFDITFPDPAHTGTSLSAQPR
jgi:DNA-binding transcriptional ArsR family regulator